MLLVFATFLWVVTELYRISFIDQTLARATHLGALAAGQDPAACETAAQEAFQNDRVAVWLFDASGDGAIGFATTANPNGSAGQEVGLEIMSDNGTLADGVTFTLSGCGVAGNWIEVRATVPVELNFRPAGTLMREYRSWAMNQR